MLQYGFNHTAIYFAEFPLPKHTARNVCKSNSKLPGQHCNKAYKRRNGTSVHVLAPWNAPRSPLAACAMKYGLAMYGNQYHQGTNVNTQPCQR